MSAPLTVVLDGVQRRAYHDRVILVAGRDDWSSRYRENVWQDPVTKTLALAPMVYHDAWRTSSAGAYSRLRLGEFTAASISHWYEHDRGTVETGGDWFLCNTDTNDALTTTQIWEPNQGFHIAYYPANVGDERYVHLECGWGTAVSLRFWSDGNAEVWKNSALVGEWQFVGQGGPAQTAYDCVNLLILPWRLRELLVVSNQNGGFSHSFADLDDDVEGQEILPSSTFWLQVPVGAAQLQVAPVTYASSGYACSRLGIFNTEPAAGASESRLIGWGSATALLVEGDDPEASFSTGTRARVRVNLTGGGTSTPFIVGATAGIGPVTADTPEQELDVTPDLTRVELDVADGPEGASLSVTFKRTFDADELNLRLATQNRPARMTLGGLPFLDGFTQPAERDLWSDFSGGTVVRLEARDRWQRFETFLFRDEIPLDGMSLADAFRFVAGSAGEDDSTIVVGTLAESFILPVPDGDGNWSNLIRVGDSAADWLTRLWETYAGSWFLGFKPIPGDGYVLHFEPQSREQSSLATLYQTVEDAENAGYTGAQEALKWVFRSYRERRLAPEANIINVIGQEPSTRRPILVRYEDELSLNPGLPRDARPENWFGEPRSYGFGDPAITTLAVAEQAANELYQKLTWPRWLAEIECELLTRQVIIAPGPEPPVEDVPLWRGDAIALDGIGVFRIVAFGCSFELETEARQVRRANYTLEYLRPQEVLEEEPV